mmetsp:Transcript_12581/g.16648  ORF Transcript_12581/g.16648 Transcript_12581/m.16648 type:complete len:296 (-) Transcript_12581:1242-2129(-)
MPLLVKPPIFAALRLQITNSFFPFISSKEKLLRSADATSLGDSSPQEIFSQYSLAESGWFHTSLISPTRMSSMARSHTVASAALAFFWGFGPLLPFCCVSFLFAPGAAALPGTASFAKRGAPIVTSVPSVKFAYSVDILWIGLGGLPRRRKISLQAAGMKGDRKSAMTYTASSVRRTTSTRSVALSSFIFHGSIACSQLFALRAPSMAISLAPDKSSFFIASSMLARKRPTSSGFSMSAAPELFPGTFAAQYLFVRFVARCTRLPRVSAKGPSLALTSDSSENLTSPPNGASVQR